MKKHYAIRAQGKVQGVFFRVQTKEKADELGLTGFVQNNEDKSVTIEAEGEEKTLQEFLEWCKSGPTHAQADRVDVEESSIIKGYKDFQIKKP